MTQPMLPRICIVTPSYNTRRYIGAAIASVLAQDWANVDYLIMDGGSTDGTRELLESFGDRLRWISEKDDGQSDAIRRGFGKVGDGDGEEILGWLNSDDTYAPGAFRAVAEYFAAHPDVGLVYGDAQYIDADGRFIADCVHVEPYSLHRLCHYSDFIVQPAAFFRRSAYEAIGGLDRDANWAMDYDLWIKVGRRFKIAYLPRVLAHFRWLADNKTATGGWGRLDEVVSILARHGLGPPAFIQLEQCMLLAYEARAALARGRLGGAVRAVARGAKIVLTSPRAMKSLLSPRTWRIIWVGQVLRARAAAAQRRQATKPTALTARPA